MRVYLLRHGIAADFSADGPRTDEERPLTAEGIAELELACGRYARMIGEVDRVVSSPLARARQTAEILADAVGFVGEVEQDRSLIPVANPSRILDTLQAGAFEGLGTMALVGHEPHLGNLLGLLLTGSEQFSIPLTKAMLVGVRVDEPQTMIGRLALCLSPSDTQQI